MASRTPQDKQIISVLKYDVLRPYFGGEFTFSDLYRAQGSMRRSEYYDANGSRDMRIYIGKINGDIICGALWRLMKYNPRRYFTNPFVYNGRFNIYKFVADMTLPADLITANVISGVRGKLREYLFANAGSNGQWRDEIETTNGFVYTVLNDGRTGPMYKKLCLLRDAIKIVTAQNCTDFEAKRKPYREYIIAAVQRLHPSVFAAKQVAAPAPANTVPVVTDTDNESDTDRIYDQMERLQITLDNKGSVSPELYDQATQEMERLKCELRNMRESHTL